jgi:hypothetical protein
VAQHGGQLVVILGQLGDAPIHADPVARHDEGVDVVSVEHGHVPALPGGDVAFLLGAMQRLFPDMQDAIFQTGVRRHRCLRLHIGPGRCRHGGDFLIPEQQELAAPGGRIGLAPADERKHRASGDAGNDRPAGQVHTRCAFKNGAIDIDEFRHVPLPVSGKSRLAARLQIAIMRTYTRARLSGSG